MPHPTKIATAITRAAAGRPSASEPASQARTYAGTPASVQTSRYPAASCTVRRVRCAPNVRVKSPANGATVGSIIAAIMSAHTATKAPKGKPIVPVMPCIPPAIARTATQAPAATTSSREAGRVSCRNVGADAVDDIVSRTRRTGSCGRSSLRGRSPSRTRRPETVSRSRRSAWSSPGGTCWSASPRARPGAAAAR